MARAAASKKPLTKTELLANIAAATELSKKQVAAVPGLAVSGPRRFFGGTDFTMRVEQGTLWSMGDLRSCVRWLL